MELDPGALGPTEILVRSDISLVSPGTETSYFTGVMSDAPAIYSQVPAFDGAGVSDGTAVFPARTGYANVGTVVAAGDGPAQSMLGRSVFTMSRHASIAVCDTAFFAVEVPAMLDPRVAVFARLAGVGITALRAAHAAAGDPVAVVGLGLVGNLAAQLFQLAGCEVVAFDPSAERRDVARQCGVATVVDPIVDNPVEFMRSRSGGDVADGAAITVEATGQPSLAVQAIEMTAQYGSVVLLGTPRVRYSADLTGALARVHWLAINVLGGLEWRYPIAKRTPRARFTIEDNYRQILAWLAAGRLQTHPLATHVLAPEQCQNAYQGIANDPQRHLGVLFDWSTF
ncbi:zinc-binding alcohol dehydrogenase [Phytohabitans sp. ZYX-F-186]|uniref:Zinc-binding alcohol dehydrogenase n=1 Tax=Phytohabitans maris TaxID=3071409 RepID=A0ABU0ZLR2_9ACTN|nr:zinc-binding alcohol dehydrogenase [Phytohabitans sp. ZYX-F-186]MDQ7907536.1 zinc-binding alcohol dehydrogenase [Phytohabitans sp. ZYX-F-186]